MALVQFVMANMTTKTQSPTTPRRSRWRSPPWWLVAIAVFVALQSVTVTLPVTVTYVDDAAGEAIEKLPVVAVWNLHATHVAGSLPSTVLKVSRLHTDQKGQVKLGLAVMIHAPVFPFGLDLRRASSLPAVYVVDERYGARVIADNAYDPQHPSPPSFLSLQLTSIDDATVRISAISATEPTGDARRDGERFRNLLLNDIHSADFLCGQRWLCQEDGR